MSNDGRQADDRNDKPFIFTETGLREFAGAVLALYAIVYGKIMSDSDKDIHAFIRTTKNLLSEEKIFTNESVIDPASVKACREMLEGFLEDVQEPPVDALLTIYRSPLRQQTAQEDQES